MQERRFYHQREPDLGKVSSTNKPNHITLEIDKGAAIYREIRHLRATENLLKGYTGKRQYLRKKTGNHNRAMRLVWEKKIQALTRSWN